MSQLTIKISAKTVALIVPLQNINCLRKKITAEGVVESLVESGANLSLISALRLRGKI